MTNKRVAIEGNLSNVRQYLEGQGYQCETLDAQNAAAGQGCLGVVISGADRNLMGMQDTVTQAPVINADGLRPDEVANRLQQIQGQQ
ncbi:MAG TPA: YkuS family protein [Bacilli bacterium]|nr:YkuS family protein [Bacilli bacterium]